MATTKETVEKVPAAAPAPQTMEVPVAKLEAILAKVEAMEASQAADKKTIAALEATVSKTRLDEAKANLDADKRPRVHFKKLHGKVVVGWPEAVGPDKKVELNFSPQNPSTPAGELLRCRYYFLDGSRSDLLDMVELTRSNEMVYARVVEDRGNTGVLEFEDKSVASTPIEIHKKFWNA